MGQQISATESDLHDALAAVESLEPTADTPDAASPGLAPLTSRSDDSVPAQPATLAEELSASSAEPSGEPAAPENSQAAEAEAPAPFNSSGVAIPATPPASAEVVTADVTPPDASSTPADSDLEAALAAVEQMTPPAPTPAATPAAPEPAAGKKRFVIGAKKPPGTPAPSAADAKVSPETASAAPAENAADATAQSTARAEAPVVRVSFGKRAYRAIDAALEIVNKPTKLLPVGIRNLVGTLAITTLATSLLSMAVIPMLLPRQDAIWFVHDRRAALDRPPPKKEVHAAEHGGDAHGGGEHGAPPADEHGAPAGGHGEEKPAESEHGGGGHH
ncbi:MAG: hypothetical protein U1D55_02990 [Phycisphaerae bacterium]